MPIGFDDIQRFCDALFAAERGAQIVKFGEAPIEQVVEKVRPYADMIDRGVKTRLAFAGGPEANRMHVTGRKVFAYARFEHPARGEVWAIYASGLLDFARDTLNAIFWVADVGGGLKVITKQLVTTDGPAMACIHATDGAEPPEGVEPSHLEVIERPRHAGEDRLIPA